MSARGRGRDTWSGRQCRWDWRWPVPTAIAAPSCHAMCPGQAAASSSFDASLVPGAAHGDPRAPLRAGPDGFRDPDHQFELTLFVVDRDRIAEIVAGEAALRAKTQPIERHVL